MIWLLTGVALVCIGVGLAIGLGVAAWVASSIVVWR